MGRARLHGARSRSAVTASHYLSDARWRGGPGDIPYPSSGAISALSRFGRAQPGTGPGAHARSAPARLSESRDTGALREVPHAEDLRKPRSIARRRFRQVGLSTLTINLIDNLLLIPLQN